MNKHEQRQFAPETAGDVPAGVWQLRPVPAVAIARASAIQRCAVNFAAVVLIPRRHEMSN